MSDRTYVDTKTNCLMEVIGRNILAFSRPPAMPLKASGSIGHRGWDISSRWACDAADQWWLDNAHGGGLEPCGRPDVLDAASDDPSAFDEVVSVAVTDCLKDMVMLKKTLLFRAVQAKAQAAVLYGRIAALEGAIEKLKETGEERETDGAGAENRRRPAEETRKET